MATTDKNCAIAAFYLGKMYQKGTGVSLNLKEAISWFNKAANLHYAPAQNALGVAYYTGVGVTKNLTTAQYWLELAAKQNYAESQFNLGILYQDSNKKLAKEWFEKAAQQGYQKAISILEKDFKN